MLITIYDRVGNFKAEVSPSDSSTQVKEIQGDNVLTLSFTHHDHISLDVDDYCNFEGERYWLCEAYRPVQKSTLEWVYDIKLYGIESMIKNLLVLKRVDGENDPIFTLTAPPREHVAMIVNCMNDGAGHITDWKVGQVNGTENIVIDYHGKYCDEALREIAEKVGAEWWVEGQTINVCRCQHGEQIELGYDKGLTGITPDKADNVKFYTRLFPVGSSRNIDPEKYGYTRLQLPGGEKYVEVNADKYGRVDHYEDTAFADIYPRRTGEVSGVRSEVKTGEDGKPFTIYYFRDNNLPFDPNDYEIGGLVKRVSFQEGSELGGLGDEDNGTYYFEVNFNNDTREFEIITIWPYEDDTQLPGGSLVPKVGDKYILWNIRMPDEYYALAEEELLTAVNKYNEEHAIDVTVFKCPTDHVWIEENDADLFVGRRVRLESEQYFPETGYRDSRITKITRKVNLPSSMDIEIGDALSRTSMQKMSDNISDAKSYAKSIGESVALPDIIRTGDRTSPTDNNLFSARRTRRDFLSKVEPDKAKEQIVFEKGLEIGKYLSGVSGGKFAKDAESGQTFVETDKLFVRVKAVFESLIMIKAGVLAGKQYITPGGSIKCTSVEETPDSYRCYFLAEQDGEMVETKIIAGDQAISEIFNAKSGDGNRISNHRYWRLVTGVNNNAYSDENGNHYGYVDLSKADCEPESDIPCAGDTIAQLGNRTDADRQSAMIFSTVDPDAPSIKLFVSVGSGATNIEHYTLAGRDKVSYGYDPVKGNAYFNCYGDLYIGSPDGRTFVRYDEATDQLDIKANISVQSTVGDKTLGEISEYVDASKYLRKAFMQDTDVSGGVIMSTLLSLGYKDSDGLRHTIAGMNGFYENPKTITSWWGGPMKDKFYDVSGVQLLSPLESGYASALVRMDGSYYFANGNIGGDADGSGWLGNYSTGIRFGSDGSMTFGSGIRINLSGEDRGLRETLESLLNYVTSIDNVFIPVDKDGNRVGWNSDNLWAIRAKYGFYSDSFVTGKGPYNGSGADAPSGGGATELRMLDDVLLSNPLSKGDVLSFDGQKWTNAPVRLPSLAGYATESWVESKGYLTAHQSLADYAKKSEVKAVSDRLDDFLTGSDTDSVINKWKELETFLSGMKETDNLATLLSGKVDKRDGYGLSKNDFTDSLLQKLNGIEAGANKYILPVAKAAVLGGVMIGSSLTASATGVLNLPELHTASASHCKVTFDKYGRITSGTSLAEADIPALSISKITGLQNALDKKLDKSVFDELFEKVKLADGTTAIHAKYGFYSDSFVSAKGPYGGGDGTGSGGTGGASYDRYDGTWGDYSSAFDAYVVSGKSGKALYDRTVTNYNSISALSGRMSAVESNRIKVDGSNGTYAGVSELIQALYQATGVVTDSMEFVTSNVDPTATRLFYRRPASSIWAYVKAKADSVYQVKGNFVTTDTAQVISGQKTFTLEQHFAVGTYADPLPGVVCAIKASSPIGATSFIRKGGTSTQFLKADGSVDSNSYALASSLAGYLPLTGGTLTGPLGLQMGVDTKLIFNNTDGEKYTVLSFREANAEYSKMTATSDRFLFSKLIEAQYYVANTTTLCTNLNADLLDGHHKESFESRCLTGIDTRNLDANTWYPVVMQLGNSQRTRIRIEGVSSAPASWNAREDKAMAVVIDYTVNGSSWGWSKAHRVFHEVQFGAGAPPSVVCGAGQLTNNSAEYIFVRGGAYYFFYTSRWVKPTLYTSTYTGSGGQSIAPTTTQPAPIARTNAWLTDNVASATKLQTARNFSIANHNGFRPGEATAFDGTADAVLKLPSRIYASDWFYSEGNTGWYNATYDGGWYMADSTWVRVYGNKGVYTGSGQVRSDYFFTREGYAGDSWHNGYGAYNVAVQNNDKQTPLMVAYRQGSSPASTGSNRLLAIELLNNGTVLNFGFQGATRFSFYNSGQLRATGEIISTSENAFRAVCGNYGFFLRNDGVNTYFMLTAKGAPYGTWNALRPLYISNTTGRVYMGNGLTVSNGLSVDRLQIGDAVLTWDSSAKMLKVSTGLYSEGQVSGKGPGNSSAGSGSSGGGSLFGLMRAWPSSDPGTGTTDALGANLGWELYQQKLSKTEASTLYQPAGNYVKVGGDGVSEVGRYIDFHSGHFGTNTKEDYTARIDAGASTTARVLTLPTSSGTLALTSQIPTSMAWSAITGKPTTLGGYGITDAVTIDTAQFVKGLKMFLGSVDLRMNADTSNAVGLRWKKTDGSTIISTMYFHNTVQRFIFNPIGSSEPWVDKAGNYSLIIGNNELTYNTHAILHTGNYTGTLDGRYARLASPNNMVHSTNEITMVPSSYAGNLWFNYRTCGGTDGAITSYNMGNGAGGYAGIVAASFRRNGGTASQILMADGGVNTRVDRTSVGPLNWVNNDTASVQIPSVSFLAYWNGAYAGTSSNLAYCNKGAFGDIVTKSIADFVKKTGDTMSGDLTFAQIASGTFPVLSKGIVWSGSTDGASIRYKLEASDLGVLRFDMVDDANTKIAMSWNGTTKYDFTQTQLNATGASANMSRFISQVATGTQPYACNSTTLNTNLNADLLDGYHAGHQRGQIPVWRDFGSYSGVNNGVTGDTSNFQNFLKRITGSSQYGSKIAGPNFMGTLTPDSQRFVIGSVYATDAYKDGYPQYAYFLSVPLHNNPRVFGTLNGEFYEKTLAFTTDNVASATKLADNSSFKAWGQEFFVNGKPKSVSGNMTGVGSITASGTLTIPNISLSGYLFFKHADTTNGYYLCPRADGGLDIAKHTSYVWQTTPISIDWNGNVGIGFAPAYKLDVNGSFRATGDIWFNQWGRITNSSGGWLQLTNGTNHISALNGAQMTQLTVHANTLQTLNGNLQSYNSSTGNSSVVMPGGLELIHGTPYIDFHFGRSTADFTARIIADEDNSLRILGGSNFKLKIGNGYIQWDSTLAMFRFSHGIYSDGQITAKGPASASKSATAIDAESGMLNAESALSAVSMSDSEMDALWTEIASLKARVYQLEARMQN